MDSSLRFDYYYGAEAEQFSFYRVPRLLIKDERFKGLSSDAKLLYGLMLDRMSLSMKNGWFDAENRAYIYYTLEDIMEDLGCAKATCVKVLAEIDSKKGIGLIEKKRQGLGKPDMIYVKNFVVAEKQPASHGEEEKQPVNAGSSAEVQNLNFKNIKNQTSRSSEFRLQEVQNADFQRFKNQTSGSSEDEPQEVQKPAPNYTNISYNEKQKSHLLNCKCDTSVNITSPTQLQDGTTYDSNNIIHQIYMKSIIKLFGNICNICGFCVVSNGFIRGFFIIVGGNKFLTYRIREIFPHFLKPVFQIVGFWDIVIFCKIM